MSRYENNCWNGKWIKVFKIGGTVKRNDQDLFYASVGQALTRAREQRKMTISQLATKSGEQFNTIREMEEGGKFMFHQASWLKEILGINLNILTSDAINSNAIPKEETNEQEENSVSDFI